MLSKLRSDNFCLHSYNAIRADSVALSFKKIFAAEKIRRIILGKAENICFSVHNFNTIRASLQTEFLLLTKGTGTEMQPKAECYLSDPDAELSGSESENASGVPPGVLFS